MLGILLVRKPQGITSHDAVNDIRRRFGTRRVGHAGTLDPMATGLLVVAVGPATRFLQYLPLEPKEYVGRFQFGVTTDSYDAEGEVVGQRPAPANLLEEVERALPAFRGLIQQLPPMHSAVKVQGKPLYHYARKGQEMRREPRTVHIDTFEVLGHKEEAVDFRVVCSGGTYIRSLAHDLGEAIGCGAHLTRLTRDRVGRFDLSQARDLSETRPEDLLPLSEALKPMPMLVMDARQVVMVREGRVVPIEDPPNEPLCALLDPDGNVFSVARVKGNMLQPDCVIPAEAIDGSI